MLGRPLNGRLPTLNIDNRCFQRPLPNTGINLLTPICALRMAETLTIPSFCCMTDAQRKARKRINGAKKRKRILPKMGHEDQLFLRNFSDKPIRLRTSLFLH